MPPKPKGKAAAPKAAKASSEGSMVLNQDEEKESNSKVTGANVQEAFGTAKVGDAEAIAEAARKQRDKELAAIKVDKADVKLISEQMEVEVKQAERALKEHNGDLNATFKTLVLAH
eukprot:NODE_4261_length_483_cov_47.398618_g3656_i0.p1 GENE.NODE_4261_length_483_cov_47.398618_g3656_i0~~NODE_4261_length_483_cov_47.398618_g3656_i0.p1  ORF type:complete len:135 (+),score=57.95 NODE_4261_length_483_cov_47.398618_g3656_i0:59-406(+)